MAWGKGLVRFSDLRGHQNHGHSDSLSLRRGLKICFSNTLADGDEDAGPGTTLLRASSLRQCLVHKCDKVLAVMTVIALVLLIDLRQPQKKLPCCFPRLTSISQPFQLSRYSSWATEPLHVSLSLNTACISSTPFPPHTHLPPLLHQCP